MNDLEEILELSEKQATEIIGKTESLRAELRAGRPNSSEESTTRGTLQALRVILDAIPVNPL